jgi:hypothetical protein
MARRELLRLLVALATLFISDVRMSASFLLDVF